MVVNTKEIDNENVYAGLVETYLVKNAFQEPKLEIKIIGEVLENKLNENRYEEVMKWLSEKRPIQYYAGYTYTFDKKIIIDRNVMIPGPEMDIFINTAKKYMTNCHKVMELCTGSGVIPVMLGMEYPDVDFYASDI
ncbi:peptide chain release factor N(5)-glutamine methyltransferase, partial [Bacillus thuringiensis]|nr:peptide chain release factor N(5)-glutamine methyltransferase [Bacillus thuringiensis]